MQRRSFLMQLLAGSAMLSTRTWAQGTTAEVPKTVKYIVPFPPGGLTDVMARLAARHLSDTLGITVLVENRAGGNAQIGAEVVAKSPPDGSHLLAITLTHAANVTLLPNSSYDFRKDLKPVALLAGSPMLVVVPSNSPITSFEELMRAAKSRVLNVGSSGNGTPPHLTMAMFAQNAGVQLNHIPYKGGAPSMTDLIGGRLDVIFSNYPESIAHVKADKLRALAICSTARHPQLPNVPTTAEAGMPKLQVENWTAAMVRTGTPQALIDRYSAELVKFMSTAAVQEQAKTLGFIPRAMNSKDFGSFLQNEIDRWAQIIRAANITVT